ncbi:hypothetical protein RHS04_06844 [Rhizoctonia solani]|uniref:Uncharacterized protein n=1 Tax=Rhizoctonia solani TaxID=456999 RepID=A0A8H7H2R4_9AGAM|nr:hypothetical protein RHS04_06844 [Rhizoctonia solani]
MPYTPGFWAGTPETLSPHGAHPDCRACTRSPPLSVPAPPTPCLGHLYPHPRDVLLAHPTPRSHQEHHPQHSTPCWMTYPIRFPQLNFITFFCIRNNHTRLPVSQNATARNRSVFPIMTVRPPSFPPLSSSLLSIPFPSLSILSSARSLLPVHAPNQLTRKTLSSSLYQANPCRSPPRASQPIPKKKPIKTSKNPDPDVHPRPSPSPLYPLKKPILT